MNTAIFALLLMLLSATTDFSAVFRAGKLLEAVAAQGGSIERLNDATAAFAAEILTVKAMDTIDEQSVPILRAYESALKAYTDLGRIRRAIELFRQFDAPDPIDSRPPRIYNPNSLADNRAELLESYQDLARLKATNALAGEANAIAKSVRSAYSEAELKLTAPLPADKRSGIVGGWSWRTTGIADITRIAEDAMRHADALHLATRGQ